jgi:hypothetical protein
MGFTETYLKYAAINGDRIGGWKGFDVYSTSKANIENGEARYNTVYLIYDDNNYLYKDGYVYGTVSANGNVSETEKRRYRVKEAPKKEEEAPKKKEAPTHEVEDHVIGDVELGIEVDKVLENVRTMSIDDLLKGFNYGLG